MKKKILTVITAGIIIAVSSRGYDVFAASAQIVLSQGNIKLNDGRITVYSSDIHYLQTELEDLFGELPTY